LPTGDQIWYLNDRLHREDGPAMTGVDGHQLWYKHGKLHRLDGPAVVWGDGREYNWVDGVKIT